MTKRELRELLYSERKDHEKTKKELGKTKRLLRKYRKQSGRFKRSIINDPFLVYPQ